MTDRKMTNSNRALDGMTIPVSYGVVEKIIRELSRRRFNVNKTKYLADYLELLCDECAIHAGVYQNLQRGFSRLYKSRIKLESDFNDWKKYRRLGFSGKNIVLGDPLSVAAWFLQLAEQRCLNGEGVGANFLWLTRDNPFKQSFDHALWIALFEFQADVVVGEGINNRASLGEYLYYKSNPFNGAYSPLTIVQMPKGEEFDFLAEIGKVALVNSDFTTTFIDLTGKINFESKKRKDFFELVTTMKRLGMEFFIGLEKAEDKDFENFLSELEEVLQ